MEAIAASPLLSSSPLPAPWPCPSPPLQCWRETRVRAPYCFAIVGEADRKQLCLSANATATINASLMLIYNDEKNASQLTGNGRGLNSTLSTMRPRLGYHPNTSKLATTSSSSPPAPAALAVNSRPISISHHPSSRTLGRRTSPPPAAAPAPLNLRASSSSWRRHKAWRATSRPPIRHHRLLVRVAQAAAALLRRAVHQFDLKVELKVKLLLQIRRLVMIQETKTHKAFGMEPWLNNAGGASVLMLLLASVSAKERKLSLDAGEEDQGTGPGARVGRPPPAELAVVPRQAESPHRQRVALGAAPLLQPHTAPSSAVLGRGVRGVAEAEVDFLVAAALGRGRRSSGMKRCQTWSESAAARKDGETAAQREASRGDPVSAIAYARHSSGRSPTRVVVAVSGWRSAAILSGQVSPPCQIN
ncbi:hypothetical protein EJB05_09122, partial [Eragrostis curvula]